MQMSSGDSAPELPITASVVPLVPAWRVDHAFTYAVPPSLAGRIRIGSVVRVPFGRRNVRGVVLGLGDETPQRDLQAVLSLPVELPLAPAPIDALFEWVAQRYVAPRGLALARCVPPRVRVRVGDALSLSGGPEALRLRAYSRGAALEQALGRSGGASWVLQSAPGEDRPGLIAELVAAAGRAGAGAALVVVPEVRYGSLVLDALQKIWPEAARVDSSQKDADRSRGWLALAAGHGLGLGGRAAVFAPIRQLGLAVVDEEHHRTYKEDRAPRYDARRVAEQRARLQGAQCVFVSASPSVELAYRAESTGHFVAPSREVERAARPLVELVDPPADRALSRELHRRIRDALRAGRRVALLAPRRGYARSLWCASCRRSLRCPECEAGVVYDRGPRRVRCPRCSFEATAPEECPSCGATDWRYLGAGSERLAEQLALSFPRATVARMDPDVVFDQTAGDEADIYLTTWIGTKPVLRPDVSLVGVLDADALIRRPDWRAAEDAYQALAAMAEWAGAAAAGGRLVVQTSEPAHHAVQAVVRADYRFFMTRELATRSELGYPPFSELVVAAASGAGSNEVLQRIRQACVSEGARVLGPVKMQPGRRRGEWHELLAKCRDVEAVAQRLRGILPTVPRGTTLRVDVDPR